MFAKCFKHDNLSDAQKAKANEIIDLCNSKNAFEFTMIYELSAINMQFRELNEEIHEFTGEDFDYNGLDFTKNTDSIGEFYVPGIFGDNVKDEVTAILAENYDKLKFNNSGKGNRKNRIFVTTIDLMVDKPQELDTSPSTLMVDISSDNQAMLKASAMINMCHTKAEDADNATNQAAIIKGLTNFEYLSGSTATYKKLSDGFYKNTSIKIISDINGKLLIIISYEEPNTGKTDLIRLNILNKMFFIVQLTSDDDRNEVINNQISSSSDDSLMDNATSDIVYIQDEETDLVITNL